MVPPSSSIRIVLEIDPDKVPIAGVLHDDLGRDHGFVGWSGLAVALTQALADRADEEPSPD